MVNLLFIMIMVFYIMKDIFFNGYKHGFGKLYDIDVFLFMKVNGTKI